jgi:hypothetical protein
MRENGDYILNDLQVSDALIDSYELENLNFRTILFQTGYLTIKHVDMENNLYTLDYPNREVEQAMGSYILSELLQTDKTSSVVPVVNIKKAFQINDIIKSFQL